MTISQNTIEENIEVLNRVIFGDEKTGELGMKKKVDEIHDLLTKARNVGGFFGGIGGSLKWIIVIATIIAIIKGWAAGILHILATAVQNTKL